MGTRYEVTKVVPKCSYDLDKLSAYNKRIRELTEILFSPDTGTAIRFQNEVNAALIPMFNRPSSSRTFSQSRRHEMRLKRSRWLNKLPN